jgi:23S rRNA (uridine2552-2'-O)-methyltransferase
MTAPGGGDDGLARFRALRSDSRDKFPGQGVIRHVIIRQCLQRASFAHQATRLQKNPRQIIGFPANGDVQSGIPDPVDNVRPRPGGHQLAYLVRRRGLPIAGKGQDARDLRRRGKDRGRPEQQGRREIHRFDAAKWHTIPYLKFIIRGAAGLSGRLSQGALLKGVSHRVAAMKRTRTSKAWMREHVTDPYVQRARAEGYRSRAAYKLMEIDDRDRLIRPGGTVVDLGAAPGGWSQVAARRLNGNGLVVALDLLEMDGLPGVEFIQGDFREKHVLDQLENLLAGRRVALVLSDMAPNMSGVPLSDQARIMHLAELGLDFCRRWLEPEGAFLVKVFQGYGYDDFARGMKSSFKQVAMRKPEASRGRSAEVYLLGKGLKQSGQGHRL